MPQFSKTFEFYNPYSTKNTHTPQVVIQMPQMVNGRTSPLPLTFYSNRIEGAGYYKLGSRTHNVTYTISGGFKGTCTVQVSYSPNPLDQDWIDVVETQKTYIGLETTGGSSIASFGGAISHPTQTDQYAFTGNYAWIRARIDMSRGTCQAINLNF
jgi:hypothetical protein